MTSYRDPGDSVEAEVKRLREENDQLKRQLNDRRVYADIKALFIIILAVGTLGLAVACGGLSYAVGQSDRMAMRGWATAMGTALLFVAAGRTYGFRPTKRDDE